mmetsp:Transcript_80699/g.261565  ORF Transcript_80699/g.261565 Transcript_80699/m.261565 type:complete len:118 (-) Transcript_80699:897-1250(-)
MKRVPCCRVTYAEEKASMLEGLVLDLSFNEYDDREAEAFEELIKDFDASKLEEKYYGLQEELFGGQQYLRQKMVFCTSWRTASRTRPALSSGRSRACSVRCTTTLTARICTEPSEAS